MIRPTHIIAGLLLAAFAFATPSAEGHAIFKKYLSEKMPNKKFTCNVCHVAGEKKTVKNSYGKLFIKVIDKPTLSKDWKSKSGADKKKFEKEVMLPAFEKAYAKISKLTFADLLEEDLIEGVKPSKTPEEPKKEEEGDTKKTSFARPPEGDAKLES